MSSRLIAAGEGHTGSRQSPGEGYTGRTQSPGEGQNAPGVAELGGFSGDVTDQSTAEQSMPAKTFLHVESTVSCFLDSWLPIFKESSVLLSTKPGSSPL